MPTIIDSLVVKLKLDSGDFDQKKIDVDKGLKKTGEESDKLKDKIKKANKDNTEGFKNTASALTKFLAILGGTVAIKRFITDTIESTAALDRFSKNLGSNIETVSAFSNAAEVAGGSATGLQGTLSMLSKAQTELALTGQSSLIPYFAALGVSMTDAYGKALPANELLLNIGEALMKKTPNRQAAFNMGQMMGIDEGTLNLILRDRKEVEALLRQQKEYAETMKKLAPDATKLNRLMIESKQAFSLLGMELLRNAMPAIEKLFDAFSKLGAWMGQNKEFIKDLLTIIAIGLAGVAAATIPINLTAVAVTGLAAAIALLWQDYQTWKRGGESFIDWAKWEPGFKTATNAIKTLRDMIEDLIYRTIAAGDFFDALWSGDTKRAKFAAKELVEGTRKTYGEEEIPGGKRKIKTLNKPGSITSTQSETVNSKAKAVEVDQEKKAVDFFMSKGWTKEQSVGLAANIRRESAFDPNAIGDQGKAYGLAQWHPDRQAEFKKLFGKDIKGSSLEDQLAFMHHELTAGKESQAGAKLKGAKTAQESAEVVARYYERPKDTEVEAAKRGQIAIDILRRQGPISYAARREEAGIAPIVQVSPVVPKAFSGIPGASVAAQGAGALKQTMAAPAITQEVSKTVETHIGEVKVYTAETDATGIVKDIRKSLDYVFTSQANYGLF